jgi:hypothetical protein
VTANVPWGDGRVRLPEVDAPMASSAGPMTAPGSKPSSAGVPHSPPTSSAPFTRTTRRTYRLTRRRPSGRSTPAPSGRKTPEGWSSKRTRPALRAVGVEALVTAQALSWSPEPRTCSGLRRDARQSLLAVAPKALRPSSISEVVVELPLPETHGTHRVFLSTLSLSVGLLDQVRDANSPTSGR